jgi:hypothetical protein
VVNQRRSNSLSPSPSASPDRIPAGEAPDGVRHTKTAESRRPSRPRTSKPYSSPFPFRQLGRPLREGERQLLTVLAEECVDSILPFSTEDDKQEEPSKTIPPSRITRTRKGGRDGNLSFL